MNQVTITRKVSTDDGTFGHLAAEFIDGRFECHTLELPWKENQRNVSCIPAGTYGCQYTPSKKYGMVYRVFDVPGRSGILIHSGNYAGDRSLGKKAHVRGCILLGMQKGVLGGQEVVLQSRHAVEAFEQFMRQQEFELEIV